MNCVFRLVFARSVSLLVILLLVGCGAAGQKKHEWAVEEGALALERDLLVSETDSFYFGSIVDVAVDSDGQMYVLDWNARHIKVIGPEGGLQDTIGGKGQGPGEFQRPRQVVVARGDSLYVLDPRGTRISVFAPNGAFAYSIQAEYEGAFPEALMVPDDQSGFVLSYSSLSRPGAEEEGVFQVRRVTASGTLADTILAGRPRTMKGVQREEMSVYYAIPFGRAPHVAMGPDDRLHFGRNDSLRLDTYALRGDRRSSFSLSVDPVPVTDEERKANLERFGSEDRSTIRKAMPSTKPAFDDLLVDDKGRYWFGRPTTNSDSTAWWVAMPDEQRVVTATLPSEVSILHVRDGRAYGQTSTEAGAPALVRYRVRLSE